MDVNSGNLLPAMRNQKKKKWNDEIKIISLVNKIKSFVFILLFRIKFNGQKRWYKMLLNAIQMIKRRKFNLKAMQVNGDFFDYD